MIPKNISKKDIENAIAEISKNPIPFSRKEIHYSLLKDGKSLPPKYVLSIANKFANGTELESNDFNAIEARAYLINSGFKIIDKRMDDNSGTADFSYYTEIKKFVTQARTPELGTSEYLKKFEGLNVRVSFGQGNQARVPWIAFLNGVDSVQEGIYPVYLYYKEKNLLILAYGVSETNKPNRNWHLQNEKSITEYFSENNLGTPERYGSSFVFKAYDTTQTLNEADINGEIKELIDKYKDIKSVSTKANQVFQAQKFQESTSKAGLFVNPKTSIRFISALLTKPFVILTGLSGSGKTKLAQAFAMWICEADNQYCIVPVGADWTNREPLLGFPNALKTNDYVKPDNKVLDLIIQANKNQDKPYILILDEMNLSHVERYFADFLSVMESREKISIHPGNSEWNGVPPEISIPKNLFIIGTVNIDETTYMFSPKVLDRANVIEFRVTNAEMEAYLRGNSIVNLENLETEGSNMANSFVQIAKEKIEERKETEELNLTLISFFTELKKSGAEFGYRSASEIIRFVEVVNKLDASWRPEEITDAAIMQKLLPKVHGSRRKMEPILKALGKLCIKSEIDIESLIAKTELTNEDIKNINYPISFEKIQRMYQNLMNNGFTSYAEA